MEARVGPQSKVNYTLIEVEAPVDPPTDIVGTRTFTAPIDEEIKVPDAPLRSPHNLDNYQLVRDRT